MEYPMDRTVAHLNIEHFRKQLANETDEAKRQTLLRLMAEHEAMLTKADDPPGDEKTRA